VTKRKFIAEDKAQDDGYSEVECPECGASIYARFKKGRNQRRLACPICRKAVVVSIDERDPNEQAEYMTD
jgi:uncharacterized Zn finger protein (UPF0148 family)